MLAAFEAGASSTDGNKKARPKLSRGDAFSVVDAGFRMVCALEKEVFHSGQKNQAVRERQSVDSSGTAGALTA
jgi:hypothetical protein